LLAITSIASVKGVELMVYFPSSTDFKATFPNELGSM